MTTRWHFREQATGDEADIPFNPDQMSSPFGQRQYQFATGVPQAGGVSQARTYESAPSAVEWTFSGPLRGQTHQDFLQDWMARPGLIDITDHLERTFTVVLTALEVAEGTPTPRNPWRGRYTMKALVIAY